MARPMNRLPQSNDPLTAFARDLQALRKKAGDPPLALMAERSGLSPATLSNAHAGKKLPTWAAVNGYVLACGGDPEDFSPRWERLRLAAAGLSGGLCREALNRWERTGTLTPSLVADEGELRALLQALLDFNGLSHRTLARQAPGYSHATYGAVLRGARPLRAKILYQILVGCGVHSLRSQEAWFEALSHIRPGEGVQGGKLLSRVEQPYRYASDIDLKMLKAILERLERGRGLLVVGAASYSTVSTLRTSFEDMLALLMSSLDRSQIQLPLKLGIAFKQVVRQMSNSSVPNPAAIEALVPLAIPFHPRLRTRVAMALKNAGELLRKADAGQLDIRDQFGNPIPMPPRIPRLPARAAS
ncbi:hypothetical protein ACFW5D_36010 [Streptomyces sp. NPDC058770]|uniref:hypothetical protein n=1 Tax=Streptomyces sp. NPDC058770 TaxID=3346631 RepID=UPI0036CB2D31